MNSRKFGAGIPPRWSKHMPWNKKRMNNYKNGSSLLVNAGVSGTLGGGVIKTKHIRYIYQCLS